MEKEHLQERNPSEVPGGPSRTPPAEPDPHIEDWLDRACAPLVGLAPYRVRLDLREEYRARLDALVTAQREAGRPEDNAVARALRQAGRPARMSRRHVTEWQVARGSVWPAMRIALWCFGMPAVFMVAPHLVPNVWFRLNNWGLEWCPGAQSVDCLVAGHAWAMAIAASVALGACAGILGRRRQALGTFYATSAVAVAALMPHVAHLVTGDVDPDLTPVHAGWQVSWVVLGTLAAALAAAIRPRRYRQQVTPERVAGSCAATDGERVGDYLDCVCVPLAGVLPYAQRTEVHRELESHLVSLAEAYQEMGSRPEEAVGRAIERCGRPEQVARAWEEDAWLSAPSGATWRATRVALVTFGAAFAFGYSLCLGTYYLVMGNRHVHPAAVPGITEVLIAVLALLPVVAGTLVRRRAPWHAAKGSALAILTVAGVMQAGAWLTGDMGRFDGWVTMMLLGGLPVGVASAGLPHWVRRIRWYLVRVRWWLATKDRPVSA